MVEAGTGRASKTGGGGHKTQQPHTAPYFALDQVEPITQDKDKQKQHPDGLDVNKHSITYKDFFQSFILLS